MEITVIAIAPHDGIAFLSAEGKLLLLRPPYSRTGLIEVNKQTVENALHSFGFEECSLAFDGLSKVVKFLKDKYVQLKEEQGTTLPSSEQLRELLKHAPDEVLLEYLNRARNELIPAGKLDAAIQVASEVIKSGKLNSAMMVIAANVFEECCRKRKETLDSQIMTAAEKGKDWNSRFADAVTTYSTEALLNYQQTVARRGHLLPLT